jgi:hypothetical protein
MVVCSAGGASETTSDYKLERWRHFETRCKSALVHEHTAFINFLHRVDLERIFSRGNGSNTDSASELSYRAGRRCRSSGSSHRGKSGPDAEKA